MARALIIGGSLGGLFAGLLLRQAGWDVTVLERSVGDLASRHSDVPLPFVGGLPMAPPASREAAGQQC